MTEHRIEARSINCNQATIERYLQYLRIFLNAMVAGDEQEIAHIQMLTNQLPTMEVVAPDRHERLPRQHRPPAHEVRPLLHQPVQHGDILIKKTEAFDQVFADQSQARDDWR